MAAPNTGIKFDGPGYYWAQLYDEDTEELDPPCVVQVFINRENGKMQSAWLGMEQPMKIPVRWVVLSKLEIPEALTADLNG